ncbi:MAG TPA: hypothetical protein VLG50_05465 [Candidatus Saccharimonadales bacterium]|nr:hypothetical protein [Candidatus Saccharimonadales bacterium]
MLSVNDDMLYEILLNTNPNDMKNICRMNKQTQRICSHSSFWKNKLYYWGIDEYANYLYDQYKRDKTNYVNVVLTLLQQLHIDFRLWYYPELKSIYNLKQLYDFIRHADVNNMIDHKNLYDQKEEVQLIMMCIDNQYFIKLLFTNKLNQQVHYIVNISHQQMIDLIHFLVKNDANIWYKQEVIFGDIKQRHVYPTIIKVLQNIK